MSLSLKESCSLYDRYCRRNSDCPTFETFNSSNLTCLPVSNQIYDDYKRVLMTAKRATGLPVTRRLPSLFRKFSSMGKSEVATSFKPSVQVSYRTLSHKSNVPSILSSVKMNIRQKSPSDRFSTAPTTASDVQKSPSDRFSTAHSVQGTSSEQLDWTRESYAEAVNKSKSILLKESNGLMVHLVPEKKGETFEKLAVKLTKSTWDILRGKSDDKLKMRDGSSFSISSVRFNEGDLAEFIQNRKNKIQGPHFIRFSRI